MSRPKLADVRPTASDTWRQLRAGLQAFSLDTHPRQVLSIVIGGLGRYGMTPTAAVLGAASAWPEQTALIDRFGSITYRELGRRTQRLAAGLAQRGWLGEGSRVALAAPDDRRLLIALAAACWCGATVTPLNPRLGADDARGYFATAGIDTLIGPGLPGFSGRRIDLDELDGLSSDAAIPGHGKAKRSRLTMLTGGTTGSPRGIPIRRRWTAALAALGLASVTGVRHQVPTVICVPLFHGYGLGAAMFCLAAGSPLLLSSALRTTAIGSLEKNSTGLRLDWGEAIASAMRAEAAGVVFGAPVHLRALAGYLDAQPDAALGLPRATLLSGADRLDPATVSSLRRFGSVVSYYGTTETGTVTIAAGQPLASRPATLGRPVVASRVQIVDERGRTLPRGVPGRIRASSPMASLSDTPGRRGYTTSDRGLIDADGLLYHLGRVDGLARLNGEFVDLDRVAEVLAQAPGVIAARAWLSEELPNQVCRVVAEVQVDPSAAVCPDALRASVLARLGPAAQPTRVSLAAAVLSSDSKEGSDARPVD